MDAVLDNGLGVLDDSHFELHFVSVTARLRRNRPEASGRGGQDKPGCESGLWIRYSCRADGQLGTAQRWLTLA